jgi:hypothetical protein
MAGMPGLVCLPSVFATDESRDWRFDLGIGRETPKLFRDPRLSTWEGDILRECMRGSLSAIDDLVAGTSMVPLVPF